MGYLLIQSLEFFFFFYPMDKRSCSRDKCLFLSAAAVSFTFFIRIFFSNVILDMTIKQQGISLVALVLVSGFSELKRLVLQLVSGLNVYPVL